MKHNAISKIQYKTIQYHTTFTRQHTLIFGFPLLLIVIEGPCTRAIDSPSIKILAIIINSNDNHSNINDVNMISLTC